MKFQINLASTDYRKIRLIKSVVYGIIALSGLILFFNILNYSAMRKEFEDITAIMHHLKNREARLDEELKKEGLLFSANGLSEINKKIISINDLLVKKAFHWTLFLSHLEASISKNISINSIRPLLADRNIDLEGEAISLKDLTDFIISLEESPNFKDVFLTNQRLAKEEKERVLFSIKARYQP